MIHHSANDNDERVDSDRHSSPALADSSDGNSIDPGATESDQSLSEEAQTSGQSRTTAGHHSDSEAAASNTSQAIANGGPDDEHNSALVDGVSIEEKVEERTRSRNFIVLAIYQVIVRAGWIFKTESIIMPAVMDAIGGTPFMRGLLPLLNRFGHSVPPLFLASRVNLMQRKKYGVLLLTSGMGLCFIALSLAWLWVGDGQTAWLPYLFLVAYLFFFLLTGLNNLIFHTMQGKLVRSTSRGRQMLVANSVGAVVAISLAWILLPGWLTATDGKFEWIFGFAGVCFLLASGSMWFVREHADHFQTPQLRLRALFGQTTDVLRKDRNFRRLAFTAVAFGATMMLFPHYQALGREKLDLDLTNLMTWVVVQNAGTAIFSVLAGLIADRWGNRLSLRLTMLMVGGGPVLAIILSLIGPSAGVFFPIVFLLVGLTPVTIKLFTNYVLELVEPEDHARYVSTIGICISSPIMLLSPLVGWLTGYVGYFSVFAAIFVWLMVGWLFTFQIFEPRAEEVMADS